MPEYVLQRTASEPAPPPQLDASQQAVVDHRSGPLLVLAGPGAGKTTTLVEVVVDRVENRGLAPEQVLVLTFSRKAAQEIRARIARRLGRTTASAAAMTFHSFCYALLRAEQDPSDFAQPIRLLSAPEFDATLATLLREADPEEWPPDLRGALRTRGMAGELRTFLAAARSQGLDAADLAQVADHLDRPDWAAVARAFDEVTSVAALENTIDHTDLIFQAVRLLDDPQVRARWRERIALVVVDEYQDTDPLQVDLLDALAGDGRDLIVVGDPYQSIYGFRGAEVRGILDFPDRFGARSHTLSHTNRYGATIAAAVRSVVENRGALGAVDGQAYAQLRNPVSRVTDDGLVQVCTYTSAAAEAEHLALALRQAHLHDGVQWRDMAVLVRTGMDITRLQRALTAASVPVEVAGDEVPLAAEPAVRVLFAALHAADDLHRSSRLMPDVAEGLLTGPLGSLDAAGLRRLGRALRAAEPGPPRSSRDLLAEALVEPVHLATLHAVGPARRAAEAAAALGALLAKAAGQIGAGQPAEQVLWTLWNGTGWPVRLKAEAEGAGEGALRANHDLDALCQLFAEAARAEERAAGRSVAELARSLEAQQIPADSLAQAGDAGNAVSLMTAHRSKGLEWDVVAVAGVQDGVWPTLRQRSSLLHSERLAADQVLPVASSRAAIAEERRLFYVACSRARRRLLVTAVASGSDDGDQPSRFVAELYAHVSGSPDAKALPTPRGRPASTLSLRGAIAELRRLGESDDPAARQRAAGLLAQIAAHPAGRAADPDRWWGIAERSQSTVPIRDPGGPLELSASQVAQLDECALRWFLGHEARGSVATSSAQGFGSIVHALAAEVFTRGELPSDAEVGDHLDSVWSALGLPGWISDRERAAALKAVDRLRHWHAANPRRLVAVERRFDVTLDLDGSPVRLRGAMDRVELGDDGVHVVDLKTTKNPGTDVSGDAQLGTYQLVVQAGGLTDLTDLPSAGAELVQLRVQRAAREPDQPKVQAQAGPEVGAPFFALDLLRGAVATVAAESFPAVENKRCGYCDFRILCPVQDAGATIIGGGA